MIINSKKYNGICECGREHFMTTETCIIEKGAIEKLNDYLLKFGLCGRGVAVYDENTYKAVAEVRPNGFFEVILPSLHLHADEKGVALLALGLPEKFDFLIAIGSGTVHDITRYTAYERSVPFVSCPTAASVDGFCSSVAAMTWHGYKKTFVAAAPKLVIADLNIIAKAPLFLTKSGFGDMIGKYISLFEWKLGRLFTNEFFCSKIYNMTIDAAKAVLLAADGLLEGDIEAYEKLIYGLLISGLAMQLLGSSRCASGAEHHISHLIEMNPYGLGVESDALHGEKVGVGTLIAAQEYHKLADSLLLFNDYKKAEAETVLKFFGDSLYSSILTENAADVAEGINKTELESKFVFVRELIKEIPNREELLKVYRKLGLKSSLGDIGVPDEKLDDILAYSPLVRNRLTLMRLRRAIVLQ